MTEQPLILHSNEVIPKAKQGYYAEVRYIKINTTKDQVLDKLIALDRHSCRAGDVLELQILAEAARFGSEELGESTPEHLLRADRSSQGTVGDQSRDSDAEGEG